MSKKSSDILQQIELNFLCPITQVKFVDPVMTDDGHTYEKKAIKSWLGKSKTSPLTGAKLNTKVLRPNFLVKEILSAFFEKTTPLTNEMIKDNEELQKKQVEIKVLKEQLQNQNKKMGNWIKMYFAQQAQLKKCQQQTKKLQQQVKKLQQQLKKSKPHQNLTQRSLSLNWTFAPKPTQPIHKNIISTVPIRQTSFGKSTSTTSIKPTFDSRNPSLINQQRKGINIMGSGVNKSFDSWQQQGRFNQNRNRNGWK